MEIGEQKNTGGFMNQSIRKLVIAGLGVAALAMSGSVQTVFAAPVQVESTKGAEQAAQPNSTKGSESVAQATKDTESEDAQVTETTELKAASVLTAPMPAAEASGCDSVTITWETTEHAEKYVLQQSTDKKHYTTVVTKKEGQEMRYRAYGLYTAQKYYYRVVVKSADGVKAYSKPLQVKLSLATPVITKLEAESWNTVALEWSVVEGADFYRLYRSTTENGGYQKVKTLHTTSCTNKVLTGVTYYYKVIPMHYNPDGKAVRGKASAPQSVAASITAPMISAVKNSAGNRLTVSWSRVPDVDGYVVYRGLTEDGEYEPVSESGADSTSWTDETVEAGTQYYYKISAYKTIKGTRTDSELSKPQSQWTAPQAPGDLALTQDGKGAVSLNWSAVPSATSYRIYRAEGTSGKYTKIESNTTLCRYTDAGRIMGKTYTYYVEAVNGTLVGEKSKALSITIGSVKVNTRTLYLGPGMKGSLSATTELPGTIRWSSADPKIASVKKNGTVTGVSQGKTQIIVSLDTIRVCVEVTVTDSRLNGIDVSKWQQAIDWKTVKASGIQFAMLRLAHGTTKDVQFENYYAGATKQGIPVGVYCYSLAKTVNGGIVEAKQLLKLLDGRELAYPIALDLESENQIKYMSRKARTQLILEYKKIVEEAGYQFVLYCNLNWLNNYIDQTKLEEEKVDIWIARYRSQSLGYGYEGGGNVRMWQYSSTGQVDGILDTNGRYINVDLDVCYDGY